MYSLRTIFFCCVILAAAVMQAESEEAADDASSTNAPTQFRCVSICGNEEGELENPELVVSYQWNHRVPVCSGLSCDTDSCANLDEKLGLLNITDLECSRHRVNLQDTAGCTCSEPKPRPKKQQEVISASWRSHNLNKMPIIIASVLYLLI